VVTGVVGSAGSGGSGAGVLAVKVTGAECGLSEPSLKVAVRVNVVVSPAKDTWQSMAVAPRLVVPQAKVPSW
jgi:hypothetical protein